MLRLCVESRSCVCVCATQSPPPPPKRFAELEDVSVGQGIWTRDGKGIVCVAWPPGKGTRLGLKFCMNRSSRCVCVCVCVCVCMCVCVCDP